MALIQDTEGMKVGVADLINQWVKGNSDVSCKSPSSTTVSPSLLFTQTRTVNPQYRPNLK